MKTIIVILAVLYGELAYGQPFCGPVTFNNLPGDTIRFNSFEYLTGKRGTFSFRYVPRSNGGEEIRKVQVANCRLPCAGDVYELTARVPSETIWFDITEGSPNGIVVCEIQGIVIPAPIVVKPLISQEDKDRARHHTKILTGWTIATGAAVKFFVCPLYGEPWCTFGSTVPTLLGVWAFTESQIVNDPWDDLYDVPYELMLPPPPFVTADEEIANPIINSSIWIAALGKAVYVSSNRANSCLQIGRMDCYDWQTDRTHDYMHELGKWQLYAADRVHALASRFYSVGINDWVSWGPGVAGDVFQWNGYFATDLLPWAPVVLLLDYGPDGGVVGYPDTNAVLNGVPGDGGVDTITSIMWKAADEMWAQGIDNLNAQ